MFEVDIPEVLPVTVVEPQTPQNLLQYVCAILKSLHSCRFVSSKWQSTPDLSLHVDVVECSIVVEGADVKDEREVEIGFAEVLIEVADCAVVMFVGFVPCVVTENGVELELGVVFDDCAIVELVWVTDAVTETDKGLLVEIV